MFDEVRICCVGREAFANHESTRGKGIFANQFYQLLYSYRPNQIYQDLVFFPLFRARQ